MTRTTGPEAAHVLGATLRAVLVAAVVAAPAVLVTTPGNGRDLTLAMVVGAAAAALVLLEYASRTPALVDFRFAPPINRLRFGLFCLALTAATAALTWPPAAALGRTLAEAMEGPLSPVDLAAWAVTREAAPAPDPRLRAAGALTLSVVAAGLLAASAWILAGRWPGDPERFNPWVNLPTFEPVDMAETPQRLASLGRLALLIGLALPAALTGLGAAASRLFAAGVFEAPLAQIWATAVWVAIPAWVILRGVALLKLARAFRSDGA